MQQGRGSVLDVSPHAAPHPELHWAVRCGAEHRCCKHRATKALLCFKKNQHAAGKPLVQLAAPVMFHESQLVYWIFIHFGLTIFSISEQLQFS